MMEHLKRGVLGCAVLLSAMLIILACIAIIAWSIQCGLWQISALAIFCMFLYAGYKIGEEILR